MDKDNPLTLTVRDTGEVTDLAGWTFAVFKGRTLGGHPVTVLVGGIAASDPLAQAEIEKLLAGSPIIPLRMKKTGGTTPA